MGDLRNKAKKLADDARRDDDFKRTQQGWTVFHFDFKTQLTRRNLLLGEAIRHLARVTGHRIGFWRCPHRGLAIQYKRLPTTTMAYDHGETWMVLHFSRLEDEAAAKRELVIDMLLNGINLYRALLNAAFDAEVRGLKALLTAPASISAEEWLEMKGKLQKKSQAVLVTHQAELRSFLLGQPYTGNQVGLLGIGVTPVERHV